VLVAPLRGWLVSLPPLSLCCFMHGSLRVQSWEFSNESWLFDPPSSSGVGSVFHPHLWCQC
jgi:hypothetical protein